MEIKKDHIWLGVLASVALLSFYFISDVAVNNPLVFGDEGYHAYLGEYIGNSLSIPKTMHVHGSNVLSDPFTDNPLILLMIAGGFYFGENGTQLLDPILYLLSGLMVFVLARRMFSTRVGVLSALAFFIIPQVITYGVLLYADLLFAFLILVSFYFLYRGVEEDKKSFLIVSGLVSGLAVLAKDTGILMGFVYLVVLGMYKKDFFKRAAIVMIPLIAVGFSWIIFNNLIFHDAPLHTIPMFERFVSAPLAVDQTEFAFSDKVERVGVSQSFISLGILNYASFAYSALIFILAVLGISYLYAKPDRKAHMLSTWMIVFLGLILFQLGSFRSEEASRYTIAAAAPIAMAAGLFMSKFYESMKSMWEGFGKLLGVIFIVVVMILGFVSINAKADSLAPIKQFSPAFFEGCEWIKENTPEDAAIFTLWAHRTRYHCERDSYFTKLKNHATIMLSGDQRVYENLASQGIDYVYLQKFSIQFTSVTEAYPTQFVAYLKNNPDEFEKVHEYPENCMTSREQDCVAVYKVL